MLFSSFGSPFVFICYCFGAYYWFFACEVHLIVGILWVRCILVLVVGVGAADCGRIVWE